MSDGNGAEDAASGKGHALPEPSPVAGVSSSDAPDHAASNGVIATRFNASSDVVRPMTMRSILNDDADELVAVSDQDGDQASPTDAPSSLVAFPTQSQPASERDHAADADALGQDDAAAGLLMGLAISVSHDGSVATTGTGTEEMQVESTPGQAETEDVVMTEVVAPNTAEAVTAEATEATEPRRDKRGRVIRPRMKAAKGKAKAVKKAPAQAIAEGPATGADSSEEVNGSAPTDPLAEAAADAVQPEPLPPRTREKRRTPPPPAPVQATSSKKTKAAAKKPPPPPTDVAHASTRPKRATKVISSYAEITLTEEDEDDDFDLPMVIENAAVKASRAAAAAETAVASAAKKKTLKRKTMSQRQFDELMSDAVVANDDDMDGYEIEELAPVAPVPLTAPGVKQRPCEFCHLDHSAFAMFYCHSCRRMYHGKCLIDAFRPGMKEGIAIEEQMKDLILYRPEGHSSVLRCVSCQAALIDLYNRPESHRDCTCPTCQQAPQKTADYRRVKLKMIVDQHNLEFALKKEQKGGKSAKKTGAAAAPPPTTTSAAKTTKSRGTAKQEETPPPVTPAEETATSGRARGARSRRRSRDLDVPEGEDSQQAAVGVVRLEPELADLPSVKPAANKAKVTVSVKSTRRGRSRGSKLSAGEPIDVDSSSSGQSVEKVDEAEAVEVDSEATLQANGPTRGDTQPAKEMDVEDSDEVTASTFEQLIHITKDDANDIWYFKIACSPSGKVTESGMYKEATFACHFKKDKEVECHCCNTSGQSLRWFIQHTDPTLLAPADDPYAYIFVVRKNGALVPLSHVLSIVWLTRTRLRQLSSGSEPDHNAQSDVNEDRKRALAMLHDVAFKPIVRDQKRRSSGSGVGPEFVCEVVCAEARYLSPLVSDETLLRCSVDDVSADVYRRGRIEVRENPRDTRVCKILCECCQSKLTTKHFREHLQKSLESARKELLEEEKQNRPRHESSFTNAQPVVPVAVGVRLRQPSALKMEKFFWAVDQLGSQAEINKAIAEIMQSHG